MAPTQNNSYTKNLQKPPKLSMENLQRTISDISLELTKEAASIAATTTSTTATTTTLPPISEIEDAKCECCGMCEECTPEYVSNVRKNFSGKLLCGLCQEAVKEEMEKNGGKREEALSEHMNACVKFNRFGRTHPVLFQAEAMKEILKKSCAKSLSPRDGKGSFGINQKKGGLARSSSCIPAITREITDRKVVN